MRLSVGWRTTVGTRVLRRKTRGHRGLYWGGLVGIAIVALSAIRVLVRVSASRGTVPSSSSVTGPS
jgi:hypothetical protein